MADPARRGQRPARRSGLTSPAGPHPQGLTATPNPVPEPGTLDKPQKGERQGARARNRPGKLLRQESGRKRPTGIGRWIEAQCAAEDAEVFGPVRMARRSCSDCALEGCHRIVQVFPAAGLLKSGLQDEAEVEQYHSTGWVIRLSLGQDTAKHVDAFIPGGTKFLQRQILRIPDLLKAVLDRREQLLPLPHNNPPLQARRQCQDGLNI